MTNALPSFKRESALLVAGEALNRGSRFLLLLLVARQVGAEAFGAWVVAVAIATFVNGVGDAGLGTVLTREVARWPDDVARYVRVLKSYLPRLLLTGVVLVSAAGLLFSQSSHTWLILLLGMGGVMELSGVFLLSAHRGLQRLGQEGFIRLSQAILFLSGTAVVTLVFAGDAVAMALVYVLGGALFFLMAGIAVHRRFGHPLPSGDPLPMKSLLAMAFPVLLSNVVFFLYLRADAVLLSLLKGSEETGLYGAAYNFVFGGVIISYTISRGLLPRFAACSLGADLRRTYFRFTGLLGGFLALSSVGILLLEPVFRIVYGAGFEGAVEAYRILVAAYFLIGLTTLNYAVLFARGRSKSAFLSAVLGLAVNLGANLLLIPELGSTGAALSMVLSEGVVLCAQAAALVNLMSSGRPQHQVRLEPQL